MGENVMLSIADGLSSRIENQKNVEGRAKGGAHQRWAEENNEVSCSTAATVFHTLGKILVEE